MGFKKNLNNSVVWREAISKFCVVWILCFGMMQLMYHFTSVYEVPPIEQLQFSLGVAVGNFFMAFVKPQSNLGD